jgi:aminopeptidase N
MRDAQTRTVFLKDYQCPEFLIDETNLSFYLSEQVTEVHSTLSIRRNPDSSSQSASLILDGVELTLKKIKIDDKALSAADYDCDAETLTIHQVPDQFVLHCVTEIKPQDNSSLEGLYKSSKMFCTQCEAEGFRKITYYLDRPDVMSIFTTTVVASRALYPILLSNGNAVDSGDSDDGQHWVKWHDPFKKPAYLFALVAGDLEFIEDHFSTFNGRDVTLRIFVEEKDIDKCDHAMQSLIKSMQWDEQVYGREYDLDIFNIVAVDDFNMGAMENKSLNIFNTSCVLAKPETTTDAGFQRVEAVVAHEYFHNWSGNRVTCRDWFQLSLKEGFTVFRDAEFSADMGSRTVKRVEDATILRTAQFAEDAGPMAHSIRPESYMEISNFYTVTIYEKGAEVVRMIRNLLGSDAFRKATDLYFDRHDGQAVTCEDFVVAMEDASGQDLQQFRRWYSQAGTPLLHVRGEYDEQKKHYTLNVKQSCPSTPGQPDKEPFHIPVAISLLGKAGALPLMLEGDEENDGITERVLNVTQVQQSFTFTHVQETPTPSLLRGFSAPVKLEFDYSRDDLSFLIGNDTDGFGRWDAAQKLGVEVLNDLVSAYKNNLKMKVDNRLLDAYRAVLKDGSLDKAMVALIISLPSEAYMTELAESADVHAIHAARQFARKYIALELTGEFQQVYIDNQPSQVYSVEEAQIAQRSLKNTALSYLMLQEDDSSRFSCVEQFNSSENMTDVMAALSALVHSPFTEDKQAALDSFYQQWQHEPLVVNQWFTVQALCSQPGTLDAVRKLMDHPAFDIKNPNKVRALIGVFCRVNAVNFHQADGESYQFLADQVLTIDKLNPQIASRLIAPLSVWRKYPKQSQTLMTAQLKRVIAAPDISKDLYEVVSKSLRDD